MAFICFEKVRIQNFSMGTHDPTFIKQQRQQKATRLYLILNRAKSKFEISKWKLFEKVICTRLDAFTEQRRKGKDRVQHFKYILTSLSS